VDFVEIDGLGYTYPKPRTEVFRDLDLSLRSREFVSLLGHNGAGKTTLLKLIYGLLGPQAGCVRINRELVGTYEGIFLLSDAFGLDRELTLRENLIFRSRLFGKHPESVLSSRYIEEFNLSKHIDKPIRALSAGLSKRADFIAGLVFDPRFIMLDEPTNSIDPVTKDLMCATLTRLKQRGHTVLLVTHDLEFSYSLSDRVVILDEGEVVVDEDLAEISSYQAFKDGYRNFTETAERVGGER
jgi:ABC-2 type transport system ATP-binding protein